MELGAVRQVLDVEPIELDEHAPVEERAPEPVAEREHVDA